MRRVPETERKTNIGRKRSVRGRKFGKANLTPVWQFGRTQRRCLDLFLENLRRPVTEHRNHRVIKTASSLEIHGKGRVRDKVMSIFEILAWCVGGNES